MWPCTKGALAHFDVHAPARRHFDVELRRAAYADLMERIKQDPPVLPLYRPYESWAMKTNVNWAPKPGHIPYVLDFRAGSISFD